MKGTGRGALLAIVAPALGIAIAAGCGASSDDAPATDGRDGGVRGGAADAAAPIDVGSPPDVGTGSPPADVDGAVPDATTVPTGAVDGGATEVLTENAGHLDAATMAKLRAGGAPDPAIRWQYPYDQTVFPRGLPSPSLQLGAGAADAIYVRASAAGVTYEGFFAASAPARATIGDAAWRTLTTHAAAATGQGAGALHVEATVMAGGVVHGPLAATWTIAPTELPGAITYGTLGAAAWNGDGGLMRWTASDPAAVRVSGPSKCVGCHTVSADGKTLAGSYGDNVSGVLYDLATKTTLRERTDSVFSWGALTPDGALLLSNGVVDGDYPPNVSGESGPSRPSRLYDPRTGAMIAAPGWDDSITAALMPAFSPDGTKVVFNHYDAGQGHSLSVMRVDLPHRTFSDLVDVALDDTHFLGWPTFTPDGKYVVYQAGSREDYASEQGGLGELYVTPSDSIAKVKLAALSTDAPLDYWPSIAPDPTGGYVWIAFTSRRTYGNTSVDPSQDAASRQKIWVAAIDLAPVSGKDPSHPAFLLPGQEMAAANWRPVWSR